MIFCYKQLFISEMNFHYYFCILCGKNNFTILDKQFCDMKYTHLVIQLSPLYPSPDLFHLLHQKIPFPLNYLSTLSNSPGSPSSAPGTAIVPSGSVNFTIVGASCKWNRICIIPLSFCVCFSLAQSSGFTDVVPFVLKAE